MERRTSSVDIDCRAVSLQRAGRGLCLGRRWRRGRSDTGGAGASAGMNSVAGNGAVAGTAGTSGASGTGGTAGTAGSFGAGSGGRGGNAGAAAGASGSGTAGAGTAGSAGTGNAGASGASGAGGASGSAGMAGNPGDDPACDMAFIDAGKCDPQIEFQNDEADGDGAMFDEVIPDAVATMKEVACRVCTILYRDPDEVTRNPATIRLRIYDFDGVANAGGGTINFSRRHIANYDEPEDARFEFVGVLLHETTHLYQFDDGGGGLVEGMADFVRIRAGHHRMNRRSRGGAWTDAYTTSGFFFSWLAGPGGSAGGRARAGRPGHRLGDQPADGRQLERAGVRGAARRDRRRALGRVSAGHRPVARKLSGCARSGRAQSDASTRARGGYDPKRMDRRRARDDRSAVVARRRACVPAIERAACGPGVDADPGRRRSRRRPRATRRRSRRLPRRRPPAPPRPRRANRPRRPSRRPGRVRPMTQLPPPRTVRPGRRAQGALRERAARLVGGRAREGGRGRVPPRRRAGRAAQVRALPAHRVPGRDALGARSRDRIHDRVHASADDAARRRRGAGVRQQPRHLSRGRARRKRRSVGRRVPRAPPGAPAPPP